MHPTAVASIKIVRGIPVDRSLLASKAIKPCLKIRRPKLDRALDKEYQLFWCTKPDVMRRSATGRGMRSVAFCACSSATASWAARPGSSASHSFLSCTRSANHWRLVMRALNEKHRRGGRTLHPYDSEAPSSDPDWPGDPFASFRAEGHAQSSSSAMIVSNQAVVSFQKPRASMTASVACRTN